MSVKPAQVVGPRATTPIRSYARERLVTEFPKIITLILGVAALVLIIAFVSYLLVVGAGKESKTWLSLAAIIAILPVALYASLRRPIVFPFCLYVALVPFDDLLNFTTFGTLTRLLGMLCGAAFVFYLLRNKVQVRPTRTLLIWTALLFWMVCTVFWAIDPQMALSRLPSIATLFLLYAVASLMPVRTDDLVAVLKAGVVGGLAAGLYGAYTFHNNVAAVVKRLSLTNGQDVSNPDQWAASLILPISIVVVFALSSRSIWAKGLYAAIAMVLFAGIYISGSRGALVAVFVMAIYLAWASRDRLQLGLVAIAALVAGLLMPSTMWDRLQIAISSGGSGRTDIWHVGLVAFKKFWLLGAGLENFTLAYDSAYMQTATHIAQGWDRASHNLLMGSGVELGIVGMLLMLLAWFGQYAMLNCIPKDSRLYNYRLIAQSATLGIFICAMFLDATYRKYAWLTFIVGALTYSAWQVEQHMHTIATNMRKKPVVFDLNIEGRTGLLDNHRADRAHGNSGRT